MKIKPLLPILITALFSLSGFANTNQCVALNMDGRQQDDVAAKQLAQQVDEMIFKMGNMPGLLIGIVNQNQKLFISCGTIDKNVSQRPDGLTVWQIGSVSKVITTTIFAMMVQENKVNLVAPLADFIPRGFSVPQYHARMITLLDLATHSSGLPREGMDVNQGLDDYQNSETLNAQQAYKWLSSYKLTRAPGSQYEYSNIGFGLLGNALASIEKMSYEQLVNKYITKKLGMKDTTTLPKQEQKLREAKSYWMNGDLIKHDWQFDFDQPSGGIYSTGNDLLRFIEYNLNTTDNTIQSSNQIAHASYVYADALQNKISFSSSAMALGWEVENPYNHLPVILHKNGWVSGFNTWVMLAPTEKIGIFSISNKPYLMMQSSLEALIRHSMASRKA